jgi:hypothetical protein
MITFADEIKLNNSYETINERIRLVVALETVTVARH